MQKHTRTILILLALFAVLIVTGDQTYTARSAQASLLKSNRIRFDVSTFEERAGRRELLAETTVEGPAGTDFDIKLQGERFRMDARFLNDLVAPGSLQMRAKLNTRRLYGQSERNLPLYEEDVQNQTLQLGFDEKLVLLPFGGNESGDASDQLKIEITPNKSEQSAYISPGKPRPLEIKILKASPGNLISVKATKIPHKFALAATLLQDGREVAHGEVENSLIEQPQEILLVPSNHADPMVTENPIAVSIKVSHYLTSRWADEVAVDFDVYRVDPQRPGFREPHGYSGAGVIELGSGFVYDMSDFYMKSSGKKYELKLEPKLAPGEAQD